MFFIVIQVNTSLPVRSPDIYIPAAADYSGGGLRATAFRDPYGDMAGPDD